MAIYPLSAYTRSHSCKPMPPTLTLVTDLLKSAGYKVIFRWSARKVPHLVIDHADGASVCWFGRSRLFRVSYPYPSQSDEPEHTNCWTAEAVVSCLAERWKENKNV